MPKKLSVRTLMDSQHAQGPKHCLNINGSIFVIFFDHSERKSAPNILFKEYLKSWDCLLTYCHPMTSILSQ